nr:4134_t:CDS:10 [Entrophospora candida]
MNFFKSKSPPEPKPDTLIPEYNANFLSKLTFWWSGDLIKLGYQRPLEKEDLYTLNDERLTKNVCDRFEKEWQKELEKTGSDKKPSLIRALNRTFFWKFWIAGFCRFFGDMLQVTSPLIIQEIISYASKSYYNAEGQDSAAYGYGLIITLFVMQFGTTFLHNTFFFRAMETGFFVRTSLIASIYRKAIVLSGKARSDFTAGKITNLMSTDTFRIDFVCGYFHVAWTAPIMLAIALGLLIKNLGPSALAGFGLLIVMGPLQGYIMKSLTTLRAKAAKVTDERVKLTQEVLQGIRVIKYYAWEDSFLDALNKLRIKEIRYIRLLLTVRAGIMSVSLVVPVFASMLAFITYSLTGGVLNAPIIFSSLALFNVIRIPLMFIPMIMASIADALVALSRIQSLLLADELDSLPKIVESNDFAVRVTDGEFLWETAPPPKDPATKKSAKRKLRFSRKVKSNNNGGDSNDNGNSDNGKKNDATLVVLNDDGTSNNIDQTLKPLIPKSHLRNINLNIAKGKLVGVVGSVGSGKSSLLSALVGEMKKVKGETEFSGSVGYCPQTAWIQNATLRDNITFGLPFNEEKYRRVIKDCCLEPDIEILPAGDLTEIGEKGINLSGGQKQRINIARAVYFDADIILLDDPLSAVDAHVGKSLFANCIQGALTNKTRILVTHHLHILTNVDYVIVMKDGEIVEQGTYDELMKASKNFAQLIEEYGEADEEEKMGVYFAWGISTGFFGLVMGVSFAISGAVAAKRLHNSALKRILRAPTKFFDTTPLGRIINRFSKDMDTVDSILPDAYRMMLSTFSVVIGTATNRELKRLDSILRSSLYAHFSETLTGLPTIRAYRVQERFIRTNEKYTDIENRAYFLTITVQRWLGLRLEGIANVLIFFASLFAIIQRHSTDPAITGLVLSYALQISGTLNWCVRQASEVEANMNAVERLVYYSNDLEVEAEPTIPDHRPPSEWPDKGQIEVKDLVVQYGPDNPPVLKSCGKSTLATSFFRFIEPTSGKIELDGIDISTIGLKDLRSKITIIPQDPVIFTGTLSNLDPFNEHEDLTLWNALKRAHLIQEDLSSPNLENEKPSGVVIDDEPDSMTKSEAVTTTMVPEKVVDIKTVNVPTKDNNNNKQELKLDTPVQEGGSNFSQGQQQLIALARALIRQSKVIIMDEATASVDFRTDHLIQTTIREEFKDSTILTIAHRLRTVIDFDKILVMDAGNIMEFDSPYLLLQNPNSAFRICLFKCV